MNALPILLAGGAALLLMGGKKKSNGRAPVGKIQIPPDAPPPLSKTVKKSGSGYPGISRGLMQEIQTMLMALGYDLGDYGSDGKYGSKTKAAVLAFQKDHMPESDGWDGKPGPKTQAALEKAEAARTMEQLVEAQDSPEKKTQILDECDPLDPGTWGSGNVCVLDGSRWVREKAQVKKPVSSEDAPTDSDSYDYCRSNRIATWDLKNGGVCLTDGKMTYLSKWLPKNMEVFLPKAVRGTYSVSYLYSQGWKFWGDKDSKGWDKIIQIRTMDFSENQFDFHDDHGTWSRLYITDHFAQWLSAIRSMALSFPDVYFETTSGEPEIISREPTFFSSNATKAINKYSISNNLTGQQLIDKIGAIIEKDLY